MLIFENLQSDHDYWFIKWVDRFTPRIGRSSAPGVDVLLQRLGRARPQLDAQSVRAVLGPPDPRHPTLCCERIHAALLTEIDLGMVVHRGRPIGTLPISSRTLHLSGHMLDSERPGATATWDHRSERIGRLLSPRQYRLTVPESEWQGPRRFNPLNSRCLRVEVADTRYLIPRTLVFKSAYRLVPGLIGALCSTAWTKAASRFISFRRYESGIATEHIPGTNVWKIVVELGLSREHAWALAPLWFDEHARACTNAIYAESLRRVGLPEAGEESELMEAPLQSEPRWWLASARFPYPIGPQGLRMKVAGFVLDAPITLGDETALPPPTPFLVTAIRGLDWPYPDMIVDWDLHNSNTVGAVVHPPKEGAGSYRQGGNGTDEPANPGGLDAECGVPPDPDEGPRLPVRDQRVEGDPNATVVAGEDPRRNSPTHEYHSASFEWLTPVPERRQTKKSSKQYEPPEARHRARPVEPETIVSGADSNNYEQGAPDPAEFQEDQREPLERFEALLRALDQLFATGQITGWTAIEPPALHRAVMRCGLRCWNLVKPNDDDKTAPLPKRGWELVYGPGKLAERQRYPRSVLALHLECDNQQVALLEIEPRRSESGYHLLAMHLIRSLDEDAMAAALETIRDVEGRVSREGLAALATRCGARQATAVRHMHTANDDKANDDGGNFPPKAELKPETLLHALKKLIEPAKENPAERRRAEPSADEEHAT